MQVQLLNSAWVNRPRIKQCRTEGQQQKGQQQSCATAGATTPSLPAALLLSGGDLACHITEVRGLSGAFVKLHGNKAETSHLTTDLGRYKVLAAHRWLSPNV
jgi:hypothetical protein